ncbi:Oxygen-independent coproporphyrinogen-III oxidase-like protein YqeR [Pontiella desulfatans]|uniref:Heme chaperone HemW n=1 Tax=Pontiella desulfatans TaxID=2750659 RepID=A0A6C2TYW3_PONDE|nr:radical SAM family heme chaperone HemW [Pontiella desulfatans]VGO12842.1 Oxygen-independent coproporphyrinogen-III oxidase-like protein YqeR [Pontiella desulfatans]
MTGLYIHIPICERRCRYCDFYKLTPDEWDDVGLFLKCLEIELDHLPNHFAPETVFIGGGTPTALNPAEYGKMLEAIHRRVNLSNVVEFTTEANPGTLSTEKLAVMKDGGINRVSIGVQSFNDRALQLLGRIHDAQTAIEGYRMLREAGFDNLNIDLIQSIPGMKPADVLADARKLIELQPEHLSYYNLIYEPGTPLTRARDLGKVVPPGDDEEADNYFSVKEVLEQAGYDHYEISNFSREGKACRHNILYWQGGEYFGCGPSAHSHWAGKRFGNLPDLRVYCDRLLRKGKPFDEVEVLSPEDKARETLVMWLRMMDGLDLSEFERLTGYAADALCGDAIRSMEQEGLLQRCGNRLALTREALFVCNAVFSELV